LVATQLLGEGAVTVTLPSDSRLLFPYTLFSLPVVVFSFLPRASCVAVSHAPPGLVRFFVRFLHAAVVFRADRPDSGRFAHLFGVLFFFFFFLFEDVRSPAFLPRWEGRFTISRSLSASCLFMDRLADFCPFFPRSSPSG